MSEEDNSYAGKVISTSQNGKFAQIVVFGLDQHGKRTSQTHHARHEGGNTYSYPMGEKNAVGDFTVWDVVKLRNSERSETAPSSRSLSETAPS